MTYPAIIFWILLIWGGFSRKPVLLYLMFGSACITTLAVVPPSITGGVTVLGVSVCAAVFVAKLFFRRSAIKWMFSAMLRFRQLGVLALFMLLSFIGSFIFPRLFSGTAVIPFRPTGDIVLTSPLGPSPANLTQTAYLLLSVITVFAFAYSARDPKFQQQVFKGLLIGAAVVVITGLADMFTNRFGLSGLLTPFRNATYNLLTDDDILGAKRVVGLMPEASVYGPTCLEFAAVLAMLRPYYPEKLQRTVCLVLCLALLFMTYLSTSSTAFVGLAVFAGAYLVDLIRRVTDRRAYGRATVAFEISLGIVIVLLVFIILSFDEKIFDSTIQLVDHLVFDKSGSASYAVRSTWNHVAWQAMLKTGGLGIGLGSARASNWVIAVFSTTGFLGATLMAIFLAQTFLRPRGRDAYANGVARAFKLALVVPLATMTLSTSATDFGIFVAIVFGMITGISAANGRPARRSAPAMHPAIALPSSPDLQPLP
jgi:hypothetical protein